MLYVHKEEEEIQKVFNSQRELLLFDLFIIHLMQMFMVGKCIRLVKINRPFLIALNSIICLPNIFIILLF